MSYQQVALRIASRSLGGDELRKAFGGIGVVRSKAGETVLLIESGLADSEPLERHIVALLELLEAASKQVQSLAGACSFEISCLIASDNGQAGSTLDHETLGRISRFPVDLFLDIYPPESSAIRRRWHKLAGWLRVRAPGSAGVRAMTRRRPGSERD